MASRIAGITVEIGGDTTKLSKALESVNKTIKTTQSELKDVNKLLKLDPSNTEAVTQKQRMLKEAIEATKEKLTTLKTAAEQANQQLADGKITQDQYDALQREIVETEQNLKSLQEQAAVTNTTLAKIDAVGEKLQTVGSQVEGVGKKFLPVTAAVTGLGTAAVKTAADFDQEMSKVAAISGATGSDFDSLREKAREMGAKTKFSASEAASAMEYMAMAGWKTGDMLDGIEGIMNLAAASGEDLATTSDIVTDALTAFGLSAADSGHFADILAAASSNANTNVSMMGETFKYCAPIAGALGFSAEDTAEAIGLMANSGIKASQAGTSLRSIMNNLAGEVTFAGKNIGEVTIATSNADGSMRSLNDILADCRVAFSGLTESEKAANAESLVGKNAMSGFLALMNAGEGDIDKLRGAIENCDGSAESMAETMQDNLNGQLTILKSQLEELAISFGDLLMPTIRKIVSAVQAFVDKLNSMDDSTRETILKVAALAAAIGPLLIVLGKTISTVGTALRGFSSLAKGIRLLSTRVGGATGLFGKLGAALGGVSAPVMAVVAVIGTLVAAFMHLWNTNEEFRTAITNIWNGIVEKVRGFCDQLTQRLNALGFDFKDIVEVLKAVWDGFCQVLALVFEGAFQVVSTVLGTVLDTLIGLFDVFSNLFQGNWSGAWEEVKGIFSGIWNGIKSIFSTVLDTLKAVADVFLGWFGTDWSSVWESIKGFFEGIWTGISDFFAGILTGIQTTASTVWNGISDFFTGVWTGIKDFFEGIWNGIVSFFTGKTGEMDENAQSTFTGISDFLGGILTGLQTVFSTVWEAISGVVSGVMDAISAVISTVMSVISGDWSTAWEDIKSAASTVWEGISGVISGAWEGISSFVSGAVETLGSGLSTAWTGIQTTASSAWDGIKGAISIAWDGIQSGVTSAVDTVATGLSGAWEGIQSTASTAWEGIKSGISSAWEGISGFFGGIWDAITGKTSDSTTQMKTETSNAWSGVEAEAQTAWSGVSDSVSTACTGMAQSVTSQIDSIKAYATTLWEALLMTASLRVKNDKYYVVLTHTTDGKKNQTWVSTGLSVTGNEGKARQIMLDMLGEKPEQAAPPDMLFSDAVRRWLEDVRHRVDEVTYQGYEVQARAHILPYFDDLQIRLCDVDGETLQTYINVKAKFGRSDGHGGLSAVSLRQHKNVLNQTLKLAQRDGLIQTNPADLVVMPHAAQFTGTFYTEAQMRDLLTAVKNERLYPIIYITALYGLRRSEVLGLKWDSINFAMQTLTIRYTVARVTKVVEKNKTKNASSFRSFPLTDDAVRLFKILLQQEQYYRNHFGRDYIDNDYVFTWEDGHPYSPDYVSHTFHKLLKKYDLPHIRFHDLRHTCASMLLSEGYGLKDVQEWLGHSDIKMTANIYGHLDIRCKRSIANGLEQALPRLKP